MIRIIERWKTVGAEVTATTEEGRTTVVTDGFTKQDVYSASQWRWMCQYHHFSLISRTEELIPCASR